MWKVLGWRCVAIFVILEHIDVVLFRNSGVPPSSEEEESDASNSNNADKPPCDTTCKGKKNQRSENSYGAEIIRTSNSASVS